MTWASKDDWRLPSKDELLSLMDMTEPKAPYINATAFPNAPSGYYWTSTSFSEDAAFMVDFSSGQAPGYMTDKFNVRCVRGPD